MAEDSHGNFMFQVVPPCGGHQYPSSFNVISKEFQVVPPCGGHPITPPLSRCVLKSFKSCPRVGGIHRHGLKFYAGEVSSRAPVWGAS